MYEMGREEVEAVTEVLNGGQLFRYRGGEGGQVDRAERMLIASTGSRHALVLTSGTAALICGLVGMGIGPGDEVIVPAYTWLASAGAVLSAGAIPVLAEVDETLTLDPEDLERRIGPRTRAVIPVHMSGRPSDMDRILAVAEAHGLFVLEDACQAIGGTYRGRPLGSIGNAGAFSFNQFKTISCGEGGALVTDDRRIHERALYQHDMGCTFRGHAGEMAETPFLGNTYRMNEILGAVLRVQLDRLEGIVARLRQRQQWILDTVRADGAPLQVSPSADAAGDCGCKASFLFPTAEARTRVAEHAAAQDPDCRLGSPIDSGLHVYTNWSVLLQQQCGHQDACNPFRMPANRACRLDLSADACPRTLAILARTGTIDIGLAWTEDDCRRIAGALCRAAREVEAVACS